MEEDDQKRRGHIQKGMSGGMASKPGLLFFLEGKGLAWERKGRRKKRLDRAAKKIFLTKKKPCHRGRTDHRAKANEKRNPEKTSGRRRKRKTPARVQARGFPPQGTS